MALVHKHLDGILEHLRDMILLPLTLLASQYVFEARREQFGRRLDRLDSHLHLHSLINTEYYKGLATVRHGRLYDFFNFFEGHLHDLLVKGERRGVQLAVVALVKELGQRGPCSECHAWQVILEQVVLAYHDLNLRQIVVQVLAQVCDGRQTRQGMGVQGC